MANGDKLICEHNQRIRVALLESTDSYSTHMHGQGQDRNEVENGEGVWAAPQAWTKPKFPTARFRVCQLP